MKYIVIDEHKDGYGDVFTKEFDNKDEAIEEAKSQWGYLTYRERKARKIFVLESVNPDEEVMNHMDGNTVWDCGPEICATELYMVATTFLSADGPSKFYYDNKEDAEKYLDSLDNGDVKKVVVTSDYELNYSPGCTLCDLTYGDFNVDIKEA